MGVVSCMRIAEAADERSGDGEQPVEPSGPGSGDEQCGTGGIFRGSGFDHVTGGSHVGWQQPELCVVEAEREDEARPDDEASGVCDVESEEIVFRVGAGSDEEFSRDIGPAGGSGHGKQPIHDDDCAGGQEGSKWFGARGHGEQMCDEDRHQGGNGAAGDDSYFPVCRSAGSFRSGDIMQGPLESFEHLCFLTLSGD